MTISRSIDTIATKEDLTKALLHIKVAIACALLGQIAFLGLGLWLFL